MGDDAEAERLFRNALAIRSGAGREAPRLANSLNNLAGLYQGMGDYAKAEPLYRNALEIRKRQWARSTPTMPTA